MHPNRLLAALRGGVPKNSVIVIAGGDFLAFARVGRLATTYLDPGSLVCIGVGTSFGCVVSVNRTDQAAMQGPSPTHLRSLMSW